MEKIKMKGFRVWKHFQYAAKTLSQERVAIKRHFHPRNASKNQKQSKKQRIWEIVKPGLPTFRRNQGIIASSAFRNVKGRARTDKKRSLQREKERVRKER